MPEGRSQPLYGSCDGLVFLRHMRLICFEEDDGDPVDSWSGTAGHVGGDEE